MPDRLDLDTPCLLRPDVLTMVPYREKRFQNWEDRKLIKPDATKPGTGRPQHVYAPIKVIVLAFVHCLTELEIPPTPAFELASDMEKIARQVHALRLEEVDDPNPPSLRYMRQIYRCLYIYAEADGVSMRLQHGGPLDPRVAYTVVEADRLAIQMLNALAKRLDKPTINLPTAFPRKRPTHDEVLRELEPRPSEHVKRLLTLPGRLS